MRKAAQSKGKRGGAQTANGSVAGGRRGGGRGPSGPKPKRFLDYPRWGKRGVWRWLPSWKQILSGFLLVTASVVGLIGYAYAKTTVPSPNAITAMQSNTYYWADGTEMARRGAYYRQNVPLTQVPVQVQNDFLAVDPGPLDHHPFPRPTSHLAPRLPSRHLLLFHPSGRLSGRITYTRMGSDLASRIHSPMGAAYSGVAYWSVSAVNGRAEHVCSAQVFQTSTCSAIARASSTSMPRYLTVLSILVWPSKSCTARKLPVRR